MRLGELKEQGDSVCVCVCVCVFVCAAQERTLEFSFFLFSVLTANLRSTGKSI